MVQNHWILLHKLGVSFCCMCLPLHNSRHLFCCPRQVGLLYTAHFSVEVGVVEVVLEEVEEVGEEVLLDCLVLLAAYHVPDGCNS